MQNVIVWRDGKVTADGQLLSHIVNIEVPTFKPGHDAILPCVTFDVIGTLTYSDATYASTPQAEATINQVGVERLYESGAINYAAYCALLDTLGYTGPRQMKRAEPPQPCHPDTARIINVTRRIEDIYSAGIIRVEVKNDLLSALL